MGFWREALGYRVFYSEPSLAVLVSQDVSTSPLLLQRVPEPKAGKNRMHLDIVARGHRGRGQAAGGARRTATPRWCPELRADSLGDAGRS